MSPDLIAALAVAFLGAPVLSALVVAYQNRNKTSAQTAQIGAQTLQALDPIVSKWMDRMQHEINDLRKQVAQLTLINAQLIQILDEHHIPVPPIPPIPPFVYDGEPER